jgi:glycosyltransferase involved in cell wall biosynthesis
MPLVSVVIPAYNGAKTITETIQSILNQTLTDFELIVINDGSTDDTVDVVCQIDDPRITILSFENGGLPETRNRGIRNSSGEFITFIDADDLWTPDKVEDQVNALRNNPDAGVAYSWTTFIDKSSQPLYAGEPFPHQGNVYPQLLIRNFIASGSNIMIRRSVVAEIGEYDATLKSAEDWDYNLRLAARYPFILVPKYQIKYRKTETSMTAKVDVMEQAILTVINRGYEAAPSHLQYLKCQTLSNTYQFFAKLCLEHISGNDGVKKGAKKFTKAIRFYPKSLLSRETQRIGLKLLLSLLLPSTFSQKLIRTIGKMFPFVPLENGQIQQKTF